MEFFQNHWKDGIEILILWIGIYQVYRAFRATRGARILVGVLMILVVVIALVFVLELKVIGWILIHSTLWIAFALVIIFQPEMRTALAKLGSSRLFSFSKTQRLEFTGTFASAVGQLSKKRIGALFALEREIVLKEHSDTGVTLDAEFSPELALTVFFNKTALHDGGMILAKGRIEAAGCVFPVSQKEMSDRTLGLRHRAAVGLTEETDAVAVVVSEETGAISISVNGELERNLSEEEFKEMIEAIFLPEENNVEENIQETLDGKDHSVDPSDSDLVSDKN